MPSPSSERIVINPLLNKLQKTLIPKNIQAYGENNTLLKEPIKRKLGKLSVLGEELFNEYMPPRTDFLQYIGLIPSILQLLNDWATLSGQAISLPTLPEPEAPKFEAKLRLKLSQVDALIAKKHSKNTKITTDDWIELKDFLTLYMDTNAELRFIAYNAGELADYCTELFEKFTELKAGYEGNFIELRKKETALRTLLSRHKLLPPSPEEVLAQMSFGNNSSFLTEEESIPMPSPTLVTVNEGTQPFREKPAIAKKSGAISTIIAAIRFLFVDVLWGTIKKCFPFFNKKKPKAEGGTKKLGEGEARPERRITPIESWNSFTPRGPARGQSQAHKGAFSRSPLEARSKTPRTLSNLS